MEKTIDIRTILNAVSKKLALILACSILCGALLFAYSAFLVEDKYTTSVSVLVHNAQTANTNTSTISDINAAEMLTSQFIEILENPAILKHVAEAVGDDRLTGEPRVTAEELTDMVSFSSNGNAILKIIITCKDEELCLDICEAMATRGAELLREKVEASSVQRIESTKADIAEPEEVSKGIMRNAFLGFILGFILSAGPVVLMCYFDNTVKHSDEITAMHGLPVLGEVPSLNNRSDKEVRSND